jgi:hypothetical protein
MSKIATTIAVLMLAFAGSAVAQLDYRSPDAKPVVITQDYRSPDARPQPAAVVSQDRRSPDALPSGRFQPSVPTVPADANTFNWGYLALGIAAALILLAGLTLTQRRRRHGLAIGS